MAATNYRGGRRSMKVIITMWQAIQDDLAWIAHCVICTTANKS